MADTEIKIDEYAIGDCENDLGLLRTQWEACPQMCDDPMSESAGFSAEYVSMCCDCAKQTREAFGMLLSNTELFFRNVRVSFTESDEKAADNIKK